MGKTIGIVKWYIEVYGSVDIEMPKNDEPVMSELNKVGKPKDKNLKLNQ